MFLGAFGRGRRGTSFAAVTAVLMGLVGTLALASPAAAADYDPVEVYLAKDASTDIATPGQVFTYSFQVGCSSLTDGCVDLVLTDTIPAPFELLTVSNSTTGGNAASATLSSTGNDITVTFTDDLEIDGGEVGMLPSNYYSFIASVQLPFDVSAELDGDTIRNTAYSSVANPVGPNHDFEASADVLLDIPLLLNSTVTKQYSPSTVSGIEGATLDMVLGATNSSNAPVDSLSILDPSSMPSNAFTYVAVTGVEVTEWPAGADLVATDWFDGVMWYPGTPEADIVLPGDLSLIQGLQFTFTSSTGRVAQAASATVTVAGALRESVQEIDVSATVTNTASSWVVLDGQEQASRPAIARDLTIAEVSIAPDATKTITPATVLGGEPVTVELRARNGGEFTLSTMTITEPAVDTTSFADQGLTFDGFVADDIEWPVGATGATVRFWYEGDADFSDPITATPTEWPAPDDGEIVVAFEVVFTGTMLANQYAVIPFAATTETVSADTVTNNTFDLAVETVGGLQASTTATDDLTRRTARVNTSIEKFATPSTIYSVPGASSVISLPGRLEPRPSGTSTGGSTVGANSYVVTDTINPTTDPFWEFFNLTAIVATSVPSGTTMSVEYWDGASWQPFDGPIDGPTSYSRTLTSTEREDVAGVRFTFTATEDGALLQPGASFQPNLRVALRETQRSNPELLAANPDAEGTVQVENTVLAEVVSDLAVIPRAEDDANITYSLLPVPGGGGGGAIPLIDKDWDTVGDTGLSYVNARSAEEASLRLNWGTGGLAFDTVEITDPSDPTAPISSTVFEAFDLVRIPAITSDMDALLTYDQITAVELFYDGVWNDTGVCDDNACDGQFPGYTLTDIESAKTVGVRFVFEESPTRSERIDASDPLAPPVGSGVADTIDRSREIALVFEVRDVRRSDDTVAVLGSTRGAVYNAGETAPGQVINTATAVGTPLTGEPQVSWDSDPIIIFDTPLAVAAVKSWTGGPLGTPPAETPAGLYPTARMTVTAENRSEAIRVDSLSLVEPSVGIAANPFDYLNITDIVSIDAPDGSDVTVTLQPSGDTYTVAEAEGLSRAELADVIRIEIVAEGRIATDEEIVLVADTQLREILRGTTDAIRDLTLPLELTNEVTATVSDLGGTEIVPQGDSNIINGYDSEAMNIEYLDYGVDATKTIIAGTTSSGSTPAIQYADETSAIVRLSGQPTGNVRSTRMVIEDSEVRFWNAYDFAGFESFSFASPINTVQVDAFVDGAWVIGESATSLSLPDGVDAEDVRGLRFTFTRDDYSAWERPFNPLQVVRFEVERREYLVNPSDQLVPSTLFTFTEPVPGEAQIGTFTNDVTVDAAAALNAEDTDPLWAATDADEAQVTVKHLPARVEVTKSEYGPRSLGVDIPFELTVINIGDDRGDGDKDATLTGLTIVEEIPVIQTGSNAGKPMLVIPDDPDTGLPYLPAQAFTYALVSPGGTEQAITNVTATLNTPTDPTEITFEYAGELELGWSLVVSATMRFRALLQAGTIAENTIAVDADQPFDQCFSTENGTIRTETNNVFVCNASTEVYPLPSSPLSITKSVRGVDAGPLDSNGVPTADDLGILRTTGTTNCATNTLVVPGSTETFYRYPCVPITRPGSIEEWGTRLYNGGNIDVKKIVAIDVLPRVGDLGVIINGSRDSKWTAALTTYPVVTELPVGWEYEVYYTDEVGVAGPRCNATDIQTTMGVPAGDSTIANPACLNPADPDYIGDRPWMLLDPMDTDALATVVAFKIVIFATESAPLGLEPGQAVGLVYSTRTADVPGIPEANDRLFRDSVAYNSLAAAAVGTLDDNDLPYRFVVEPRKVGVALAMGEIELLKDVAGAAASYATDSFELSVACTTPDGDPIPLVYADGSQRSPYTVTEGTALLVPGIPLYSVCSVSEARDYGQSNIPGPQTVIAQAAQAASLSNVILEQPPFGDRVDTEVAQLTNQYPAAALTLTKTVETNGAVNEDGEPIEYHPALASVTCTFDNGTGAATILDETDVPLVPGTPVVYDDLPAGALCSVTETNQRGAATTSVVTTAAGAVAGGASPAQFELTEGANEAAFTNEFGVGSLRVVKVVAGLAAGEAWAAGPFTIQVTCTNSNATSSTVFSDSFTLTRDDDERLIENLATGSVCVTTETDSNGATSVGSIANVTINTAEQSATITNTFSYARLTVSKTVTTSGVDGSGTATRPGPFDFSVACTFTHGGTTDTVLASGFTVSPMTFQLSHGQSQALTGMPAGAVCSVTEATPVGSPTTVIRTDTGSTSPVNTNGLTATVAPLTADTNPTTGTNTAVVTNTYPVGTLRVTKSLQGGASTQFGTGPFTYTVTCTQPGITATYTKDISVTSAGGWTTSVPNILAGSVCSVAETNFATSGADAMVILNNSGVAFDGTGVTIVGAATRTVTFQNWYLTGAVNVTKEVTGPGAAFGGGPFTVSLACERGGQAVAIAGGASRTLVDGGSTQYTLLPSGAECTLTETNDGGAGSTVITDADGAESVDGSFTFTVVVDEESLTDNQTQPAITVTNSFELADLTVSKAVVSDAEKQDGSLVTYGEFAMQVTCLFNGSGVRADGFASNTMTFTLDDGESRTLEDLPAGAVCTVTETDAQGAARTSISVVSGGGAPSLTEAATAAVTLAPSADNSAAVTNEYDSGSVTLSKVVDGLARAEYGTGTFTVTIECTLPATGEIVWTGTHDFVDGSPAVVLSPIATNAVCDVVETATAGATSTTITVDGEITDGTTATAIVPAGDTAVTVTNTFDYASLDVSKEVISDAVDENDQPVYPGGSFAIEVECEFLGATVLADGYTVSPMTFALGHEGLTTLTGLPAGSSCDVTETDTVDADSTSITTRTATTSDSVDATSATIDYLTSDEDGATNAAEIVNRYGVATFTVAKVLEGAAAEQFGTGPFDILVVCTAPGDVEAWNDTVSLPEGDDWFVRIDDLPNGSVCTTDETNFAETGADAQQTLDADGEPVTSTTVTADEPGYVAIHNWYLTGAVDVTKSVTGDASSFATADFEVTIDCVRDGEDVFPGGWSQVITDGATVTFDELPSGAECTVTETDVAGATTSQIELALDGQVVSNDVAAGYTFTVSVEASELVDNQTQAPLTVVNDFPLAGLVITKTVDTPASDGEDSVDYGPFPVTVTCEFVGETVYATGYDPDNVMAADLENGEPWTLAGLPAGAECSIVEDDALGADSTEITTVIDGVSDTVEGTDAIVELAPGDTNTAEITNRFGAGSIVLSKVVTGDGREWGTEVFEVEVECILTDASGTRPVFSGTYEFEDGDAPITLSDIATGATCTVTETATGAASATSITVGDGDPTDGTSAEFTVPSGELDVTVTNRFDVTSIDVTKERTGDGAELWGDGPFEVTLVCERDVDGADQLIEIPGGATRSLEAPDYLASYDGLPVGADCAMTETEFGGANGSSVSPQAFELAGIATDVTVSNVFNDGDLVVTKQIVGDGVGVEGWATGPFEVSLECTRVVNGETVAIEIPGGAVRALTAELPVTYTGLPEGALCEVTETETGEATTTVVSPAAIEIASDETADVTVTNTFTLGSIEIVKTASQPVVEAEDEFTYTFEVTNTGTVPAAGVTVVDEIPALLTVLSISSDGWTDCAVADTDAFGYGGVLTCVYDETLAAGASADAFTITVGVHPDIEVDQIDNVAVVSSTTPGIDDDEDDERVLVKWLAATVASQCVLDAPWLDYSITTHNLETAGETLTVTWRDGTGAVIHTQEIALDGGPIEGELLWPGAATNANGVGILWPGYRAAMPGETPTYENLVLDPTLPEYGLRSNPEVTFSINPSTVVATSYPEATPDCAVERDPGLWVTKVASTPMIGAGDSFEYVIEVGNDGLGAVRDVVMTDEVPSSLKVLNVTPAEPASDVVPAWSRCEVNDRLPSGYGGTVNCILDRPLGYLEPVPAVVLAVQVDPSVAAGGIVNTASLTGLSVDGEVTLAAEDSATVVTPGMLAFTGSGVAVLAIPVALGMLTIGAVLIFVRRRRDKVPVQ